jgi:hypothetical protein
MTLVLKPKRGGFLHPFRCGEFIREFLLGHGPYNSLVIDPEIGAPQADIFYHYKQALRRVTAEDKAVRQEEKSARKEKRPINPDAIETLTQRYLEKLPYKSKGCRYHSFIIYFSNLQRLGWVEPSGKVEPSAFQDNYPQGNPRIYYRLTRTGKSAPEQLWIDPRKTLYSQEQ